VAKKELVEVEGILCEVKDPSKEGVTKHYQSCLSEEINKYKSTITVWNEKNKGYCSILEANVNLAGFVLGWLRPPEDKDEYNVIKGFMPMKDLEAKRRKEARKTKKPASPSGKVKKISGSNKTSPKKAKVVEVAPKEEPKKKTTPKKPAAPKKPAKPKKPTVKSLNKK